METIKTYLTEIEKLVCEMATYTDISGKNLEIFFIAITNTRKDVNINGK